MGKQKIMLGLVIFLPAVCSIFAENESGSVGGDGSHPQRHVTTTPFTSPYDTTYTLGASPNNGYQFITKDTSASSGTTLESNTTGGASSKKTFTNPGDGKTGFSMSLSGMMVKPGGSGGSAVSWGVTAGSKFFYITSTTGKDIIVPVGDSVIYNAKENGSSKTSKWKINGTSPDNDPSTSSIIFNRSWWDVGGWFDTGVSTPNSGTYTIWASPTDSSVSDSGTMKIVEVSSISVSGATQIGSTKNWAVVKGTGDVTITAVLNPGVAEADIPSGLISWSGGTAVAGHPLQRKVSKGTSAKTTVTATCGTSSKEVDIWVLWATITIHTSGTQPEDAYQLPAALGGGTLGPFENTTRFGAAMTLEATISPSGVHDVVTSGWGIKRKVTYRNWDYVESLQQLTKREGTDEDDNSPGDYLVLTPTSSDKIYDVDAPSDGKEYMPYGFVERHYNFTQHVEWNGTKASNDSTWSVEYKYTKSGPSPYTYTKIYNNISTSHITIPTSPTNP